MQFVEHGRGVVPLPHPETQGGVVGIGEPLHLLERDGGGRVRPGDGVIEYAASTDCGELVPVTDERNAGARLVGGRQECTGGVLVEHPGLVDQQQVAWPKLRRWLPIWTCRLYFRATATSSSPSRGLWLHGFST